MRAFFFALHFQFSDSFLLIITYITKFVFIILRRSMTSIRHMMSAQLRHPQPIMQFQMVFSQKLINNICLETLWELSVGEIYSHRIVNDELGRTESGRVGRRSWESQVEESLKSGLNDRVTSAQLFTCGAAAICHHTCHSGVDFVSSCFFFISACSSANWPISWILYGMRCLAWHFFRMLCERVSVSLSRIYWNLKRGAKTKDDKNREIC